jgi:glycosyltransferase involved in cell wall biosynthesis
MIKSMDRPIRVLHILWSLGLGGAETWLVRLLENIDRKRFQIDILVHLKEPGFYDEKVRSLGSPIILGPPPTRPLSYASFFKKILEQQGPYDIVHSHLAVSGYHLRLAHQTGVSGRIAHSHTDETAKLSPWNLPRRIYIKLSTNWIRKYANLGIAVSGLAAQGRFGADWREDERFKILPCGIELGPYAQKVDPRAIRAKLGIPDNVLVIGHVGSFRTPKNHTWMIDIGVEIIKRNPEVRFLFVGDGPLRQGIEEKVEREGLVDKSIFLGQRNDVPNLVLGAMDVFLFPSLYEGMPLSMVEAQTAGLPCIVSDTIAEEATVIKPLVNKVSLTESASHWAEAILSAAAKRPIVPQTEILRLIEKSHFNVYVGVRKIEQWYRELAFKH